MFGQVDCTHMLLQLRNAQMMKSKLLIQTTPQEVSALKGSIYKYDL